MTGAFEPSGGVVVRAPLLPFERLTEVLEDVEARLRGIAEDPVVREAIAVASSSLSDRMAGWLASEATGGADGVRRAVLSYVTRMTTRPTPFGLFATCAAGTLGSSTTLVLAGPTAVQRRTRLDFGFLAGVVDALDADRAVRAHLRYRPNTALYRAGGRIRLAERRVDGATVRYHRVVIEEDDALAAVLANASEGEGATVHQLAAALVDDDITIDEATEFVHDLIDAQALSSTLGPPITGTDATAHVIAQVTAGAPVAAQVLGQVATLLDNLDGGGIGQDPAAYDEVAQLVAPLGVSLARERLVQVDLTEPGDGVVIGANVVAELMRGAELLHQLSAPVGAGAMADFRTAFVARYGDLEVPLAEALDEEIGVGFGGGAGPAVEGAPLLEGLDQPPVTAAGAFSPEDAARLRLLSDAAASGADEIRLTPADIAALSPSDRLPLPDAAAVTATLVASSPAAVDAGDFRVLVSSVTGPSGARVLGRFAADDPAIGGVVASHLAAEEALDPDVIYAEVVHLPEGRTGNVLSRPVLRAYEIPFSGMSGAPVDRQILLDDLLVRVVGQRVVLRSRRLDRIVRPRMSTAHNHVRSALAPYRFLVSLAYTDVMATARWSWGPLDAAPFLPRVTAGRIILARARWSLTAEDTVDVRAATTTAERTAAVERLRKHRRLPVWVVVAMADHELPVDLTTEAGRDLLAHEARGGPVVLHELLPGPGQLVACRPGGSVTHELVLPIVRTRPSVRRERSRPARRQTGNRFAPGSEWMAVHLPAGRATADLVLREVVSPLVAELRAAGTVDRWFYIRYHDATGWHLRLRLHGDPPELAAALPAVRAACQAALDDGRLAGLELHTYEREVDRYGGHAAIDLAEQLFMADSDAALQMVTATPGDAALVHRWQLTLVGIDWLLADLGFQPEARGQALAAARDALAAEQGPLGAALRRVAGNRYRSDRATLMARLDGDAGAPANAAVAASLAALRHRSEAGAAAAAQLRDLDAAGRLSRPLIDVGLSLVHMHVNRLLRGAPRHQELVLYDLLVRLHAARARSRPTS